MSSLHFTPSQQAAVGYRGGNLLLSAAAGSGKTAALTARITRLVTEGEAELHELLIVTYTRAAAAEMRDRIGKQLTEALAEARAKGDEQTAARAAKAVGELPAARISTIHSFLYQSMKPYFPALGLSPDVRVLDEQTAKGLRAEVMKDTVDDAFSEPDSDPLPDTASFPELADILGHARDADAIDGELLWLDNRTASAGLTPADLTRFADRQTELADGEGDPLDSPWGAVIRRRCAEFASHYRRALTDCRDSFGFGKEGEKYAPDADYLIDWAARAESLALPRTDENAPAESAAGYDALAEHMRSLTFPPMPRVQKKDLTEAGEAYKLFRAEMKKQLERLLPACFSASGKEIRETAAKTARILRRAALVLGRFREKLAARKREIAALDYGDLETCALALLTDRNGGSTRAAEEIGQGIRYLFIDEYQDTNDVQDRIFRAVSPTAYRFMVGDIKQSIYRFRGADPSVFSSYREAWSTVTPEECEAMPPAPAPGADPERHGEGRSLFMSENFRCAEAVVRFSNAVSAHLLPFGGIPYEAQDRLIHARADDPKDAPDAEVVVVERPQRASDPFDDGDAPGESADESDSDLTDGAPGDADLDPEAEYVADRIAGMVGRYRDGGSVVTKAGDIAVLLRSNRSAERYRAALEARGIPAVMKTSRALGSYPSVMLLTCLLNLVDNPLRDIYTAGALRSPVFSVDLGELIAVREAAGDLPLYVGVEKLAEACENGSDNSSAAAKCRKVRSWLLRQRAVARGMTADRYTEFLLRDTDFFSLDGIRENGAERDALNRFATAVRNEERMSSGGGLSALLESLPDLLTAEEETGGAASRREDAVSVMSIHASKGLEFPICFLCESAKKRNMEDERRSVLFDSELGFGMTLPDPGGLAKCDTFLRQSIGTKIAREAVNEEMRMLYVAMTRARDLLIVTGKSRNPDKLLADSAVQARSEDAYRAQNAGSYLNWILEALAAHPTDCVKVTVTPVTDHPTEQPEQSGEQSPDPDSRPAEEIPPADTEAPSPPDSPADPDRRAELLAERFSFRYDNRLGRIPSKLTVSRLNPEILDAEGGGVTLTLDEPLRQSEPQVPQEPTEHPEPTPEPEVPEEIPDGPARPESEEPPESEAAEEKKRAPKRPSFMTGGPQVTGADRGSATHVFLQFVRYDRLRAEGVGAECERLVREKYLSKEAAGLIYRWQLERFRESSLMDALLRSPMVKREFRFNVLLPAERFTRDPDYAALLRESGTTVTVQGVVDCIFRDPDDGGLTLVDYKTDALTAEERRNPALAAEKLLSRHRDQLTYYREICASLFEEPVRRALIYSTVLAQCVEVP